MLLCHCCSPLLCLSPPIPPARSSFRWVWRVSRRGCSVEFMGLLWRLGAPQGGRCFSSPSQGGKRLSQTSHLVFGSWYGRKRKGLSTTRRSRLNGWVAPDTSFGSLCREAHSDRFTASSFQQVSPRMRSKDFNEDVVNGVLVSFTRTATCPFLASRLVSQVRGFSPDVSERTEARGHCSLDSPCFHTLRA